MKAECGRLSGWLMLSAAVLGAMPLATAVASDAGAASSTPVTSPVLFNRSCEQTAATQVALDECAQTELREVQSQLTPLLRQEYSRFGKKVVDRAQAQWRRFRDSECSLEARPYSGGTIQPLIVSDCDVQLTVERIQELGGFLKSLPH